ncbi:hypothetical protein [Papillibacter cinnamivorans]|nr:hypothetical protein [Papillibacter cinnamivorans]
MKKKSSRSLVPFIILLLCSSVIFFIIQTLLFHDVEHSLFLFFQDFIFLPIEVILVSFLIDRFISSREKTERRSKLHILMSEYFTEAGNDLILCLNRFVTEPETLHRIFALDTDWDDDAFCRAEESFLKADIRLDAGKENLAALQRTLLQKKRFLLTVFENPNTLEHTEFTDTALAIHHLLSELRQHDDLEHLSEENLSHLSSDMKRAYGLIVQAWISNMRHLRGAYPYLYSLAVRRNIFLHEPEPGEHPCRQ